MSKSDEPADIVSRETMPQRKINALISVGWVTQLAMTAAPIVFDGDPELIERTRRECDTIAQYVKAGF